VKKLAYAAGFLAAGLLQVPAQISVDVALDQEQFLPGETMIAAVHITNLSGRPLVLGESPDWLTFSVQSRDSGVVPRTGAAAVEGRFVLESSKRATKRVDVAPAFALDRPGRFELVATVRIKGWERELKTAPRHFDVIEGTKLWEQEIGVPPAEGATNAVPEIRKYMLQQARYLKNQIRLYFRLTDATGTRVYRVTPVGAMISFSQPEPQVDRYSNLHVLYQNGPHTFSYTVFNPLGQILARQTYDWSGTRPRLKVGPDGKILVSGGTRRNTASDLPPSDGEFTPDLVPPQPEGATNPPAPATNATPRRAKQ
jgi:hypothetical protein